MSFANDMTLVNSCTVCTPYSVEHVASAIVPTCNFGDVEYQAFRESTGKEPVAMVYGKIDPSRPVNIRMHDQCMTSEVFDSAKCDCLQQLRAAMGYMSQEGGMIIYLPQEGRGIGLANKIAAYALQRKGADTIEANQWLGLPVDSRTYECVPTILKHNNITSVNIMTNNPEKIEKIQALGVVVNDRIPILCKPGEHSVAYMRTKAKAMRHMLPTDLLSEVDPWTASKDGGESGGDAAPSGDSTTGVVSADDSSDGDIDASSNGYTEADSTQASDAVSEDDASDTHALPDVPEVRTLSDGSMLNISKELAMSRSIERIASNDEPLAKSPEWSPSLPSKWRSFPGAKQHLSETRVQKLATGAFDLGAAADQAHQNKGASELGETHQL